MLISTKPLVVFIAMNMVLLTQPTQAEDNPWGVDISLAADKQDFNNGTINEKSFTVSPFYQTDKWLFSANLPWQHEEIDTHKTVIAIRGPKGRLRLIPTDITQEQLPNQSARVKKHWLARIKRQANSSESNSGIGDVSLLASHSLLFSDDQSAQLKGSAIAKLDNGNEDDGLGSGTREYSVELSADKLFDYGHLTAGAGYTFINSTNTSSVDADNTAYGYVDAALSPIRQLDIGLAYHYGQASYADEDNNSDVTYYLEFMPNKRYTARIYYLDNMSEESEFSSDKEYGASFTLHI